MIQHTPEPWEINAVDHCLIRGCRGLIHSNIARCIVVPAHGQERYDIAEANARLIVASPKMLEALKTALGYVGGSGEHMKHSASHSVAVEIEAAIAKAEGAVEHPQSHTEE